MTREAKRDMLTAFMEWGDSKRVEIRSLEDKMLDAGDGEWYQAIANMYLDHCEKEASNAAHS